MLSVSEFADNINVPVNAVKLVLTVYLGYVFGTIHRSCLFARSAALQNLYFTVIGLMLISWNYGMGIIHSAFCIVMQWMFFKYFGTGNVCVAITFVFQLGYLVAAYVRIATDDYDITWTMPHCVLTLRLIGLCWDVYDGHRDETKLSVEQKTLFIKNVPSLLEIFGFCYYYGGFMIGPQFPLRRFRQMVNGKLTDNPRKRPRSLVPAFRRGLSGTIVIAIQIFLNMMVPESMLLKPEFLERGFLYITAVVCLRAHIVLLKYISIWMVNEGVCILCGLGYYKEGDTVKWDAVRNVRLKGCLTCRNFQQLIQSFNINTNQWIGRYVFKRLRFLGSRTLSHIASLLFIAVWHGYHEGYFTAFANEFVVITVERSLRSELSKSRTVQMLKSSKSFNWFTDLCCLLYYNLMLGYCHLDFFLRKWQVYSPIQWRMYCYGHVFCFVCWMLLKIHCLTTKEDLEPRKKLD